MSMTMTQTQTTPSRGVVPDGTMRAAVVVAPDRPLVVADVPIPAPGPGQALVRVITSAATTSIYPVTAPDAEASDPEGEGHAP